MDSGVPTIKHLFISEQHNFFSHLEPDTFPAVDQEQIECRAGCGIVGDRFFDHKPDYKGQITFFAEEVHEDICRQFGLVDKDSSIYRRNIVTQGLDLNALIGVEFEMQGVRFCGTEEARPCKWMNGVVAEGAKAALEGRGGLRARILTDGMLSKGLCEVKVLAAS